MNNLCKTKQKFLIKKKLKVSITLLVISALLFTMARYIYTFADLYYKYIYVMLINSISKVTSLIPFLVYEILLYGFIIFICARIVIYIYLGLTKKFSFKKIIVNSTTNLLLYISIFIFLNMITLIVNSFKSNFITLTELKIQDNSAEKLVELGYYLKDKLNELDGKIKKDEYGVLKLDNNAKDEGIRSMEKLGETYPSLSGFYPKPKPYIFSKVMSYQLLMGETNFTLEANFNNDMPESNIPSTICHELSHIKGFNNEDEANYIGFLACINSENHEYQYSGYLMAYSYCMSDLYYFNLEAFNKINSELSDNVKLELRNDTLYWNKYRGIISTVHSKAYDELLKMSGQEEGIRSYNAVVKLLISGYKVQY